MLTTRTVAFGYFLAFALVLGAGVAFSQTYPNKSIRIVTAEIGGSGDIATRTIAQEISGPLGQPVIVDNRGSGFITGEIVASAAPDGYTLLFASSALWVTPLLRKTPYDPIKDFAPIALLVTAPNLLVVHPSLPAKSVKELIDLAKAKPGVLNYASSLPGTTNHLAAELFKSMAGVNIVGINYKGGGPGMNDLLGGHVQMMFVSTGLGTPHLKSGKLRALGVTSLQPSALAPGLPTVASGLPGFEVASVVGSFAPAKTPAMIINRLNQEIVRALNRSEVKEKYLSIGVETVGSSPAELTAKMKSEVTRLGKVIRDAGIKAE